MSIPDPSRGERERQDRANVLRSEMRWVTVVGGSLGVMMLTIIATSLAFALHPPSNVELIDSDRLHLAGEFVESNLGAETTPDGRVVLRIVATKFAFIPRCVPVPEGVPVRMRLASPDVVHGLIVNGTNANTMVVPGYVAQVETTFQGTGDRLMPCHEYCGQGHSQMWGIIRVVPQADWRERPGERQACRLQPAGGS